MTFKLIGPILFTIMSLEAFSQKNIPGLSGAWMLDIGKVQEILLFQDGYFTHTRFDQQGKEFSMTRGGTYVLQNAEMTVQFEFNSANQEEIGQKRNFTWSLKAQDLTMNVNGRPETWKRLDNSSALLAGVWKISERMADGKLTPIHQSGTRKTLKILTGSRFQWVAIDLQAKSFSGTGGGTYTFKDGKYTETIEFFSRDNSRVGASLSFEGKIVDGNWHHSGVSSKGDKIYEVWAKGH